MSSMRRSKRQRDPPARMEEEGESAIKSVSIQDMLLYAASSSPSTQFLDLRDAGIVHTGPKRRRRTALDSISPPPPPPQQVSSDSSLLRDVEALRVGR